jgi:hypothetical protein
VKGSIRSVSDSVPISAVRVGKLHVASPPALLRHRSVRPEHRGPELSPGPAVAFTIGRPVSMLRPNRITSDLGDRLTSRCLQGRTVPDGAQPSRSRDRVFVQFGPTPWRSAILKHQTQTQHKAGSVWVESRSARALLRGFAS